MKMKNALDGLISMLGTAVVRTTVLECRSTEITQTKRQRGKKKFKNRKNQSQTRLMVQYQLVYL